MNKTPQNTDHDAAIEEIVVWGLIILAALFFIIPLIGAAVIFAVLRMIKKENYSLWGSIAGVLLLITLVISGHALSYLAIVEQLRLPFISQIIEKITKEKLNVFSCLGVLSLTLIFSQILHLIVKYKLKMPIKSQQDGIRATKNSGSYLRFRKKRVNFLKKEQLKYRKSNSKQVFIGFSDLKERVIIPDKEFNYHMLAVGGTGTGKTTLIASIMEGRLRAEVPIIFVDGKGERKSMLEFKELCEAYGKKVYMFSEQDGYTYNPVKYGTATEIRDKVMNLFEWSEPFYKNFASRFLQLVVLLINATELPQDLYSVFKLLSKAEIINVFNQNMITEDVEVEVQVEVKKESKKSTNDNPFAALEDSQNKISEDSEKTINLEKKQIRKLPEHLAELQTKFNDFLNNEEAERNLTGLRNQLGELLESDLGHLFVDSENQIDLTKITDEGNVAIFSISGNRYRDYIKKLGKIIILDVNSLVAYRQSAGSKKTLAIYDEFSAYGNGEIVDIVNKSRSAGFECIISTQTIADLDAVEPFLTSRILSNCNILAAGRVNDSDDAEKLAKQFSTFQDLEVTTQIENKNNVLKVRAEKGTVKDVEAFIAHPREIKSLQIGEIFLSRKMVEEGVGKNYTRRVYVRNALEREGIQSVELGSDHEKQGFQERKKAQEKQIKRRKNRNNWFLDRIRNGHILHVSKLQQNSFFKRKNK